MHHNLGSFSICFCLNNTQSSKINNISAFSEISVNKNRLMKWLLSKLKHLHLDIQNLSREKFFKTPQAEITHMFTLPWQLYCYHFGYEFIDIYRTSNFCYLFYGVFLFRHVLFKFPLNYATIIKSENTQFIYFVDKTEFMWKSNVPKEPCMFHRS